MRRIPAYPLRPFVLDISANFIPTDLNVLTLSLRPWLYLGLVCLLSSGLAGCGSGYVGPAPEDQLRVIWQRYRYGYILGTGDLAISPQFDYAMPFSEGLGGVNVGGTAYNGHLPVDGKWGFVNRNGRFVINPKYYSPPEAGAPFDPEEFARVQHDAYVFSEGLAAVRTESEWIYINDEDKVVIRNPRIESPRAFHEGLANVYVNGRWGYIDKQGQFVIEPQFLYPSDFRDNHALVVDKDGRELLIDRRGQVILPQYRIDSRFHEGMARAKPLFRGEDIDPQEDRFYSLVDAEGRFQFPPEFDFIGRFGSGMAPVLVGSRSGDPLSQPQPLAATEEPGGRWGWINQRGIIVKNPKYQGAKGFSEGIGAVKYGDLWAYVNTEFSLITDYEFRWVGYFHNGLAEVRLGPIHGDYDGRYAYIDRKGEIIWVEP